MSLNLTARFMNSAKRVTTVTPSEMLEVSFELESDLDALFNWNVRQLYVAVTASYDGTTSIVHDEIVRRGETEGLSKRIEAEYGAESNNIGALEESEVTLDLIVNIMPSAGVLKWWRPSSSSPVI
ncbi:signal peptidase 22kDa subunit [Kipferlia bialata]|uniref:Signal peptidase complex subunit 3 n=1 Tax=Kipferlia bialata TaxID=797122 RepID=A0A9K3CTD5_9EUKA|nr:signal peptidase 22kDa subunit [Kipferlia bialata]|eukprot:g4194.t1